MAGSKNLDSDHGAKEQNLESWEVVAAKVSPFNVTLVSIFLVRLSNFTVREQTI